ncbi:MAG: hypothetical protein AAGE80_16835 [Pseudomonadota bacterium]
MIVAAAFIAGLVIGWIRAARRGGTTGDRVQFALAHAIPAGLAALIFVVLGSRMGWLG